MEIKLNSDFAFVGADSHILGYIGETNARTINFAGLSVDGADFYKMQIDYPDNVSYEVDITAGSYTVDGSLLRMPCKVKCQILACKSDGDKYTLVKKSNTFTLDVKKSLSEEAIPTYEQSVDALEQILNLGNSAEKSAEQAKEYTDTAEGYMKSAESYANSAEKSAEQAKNSADNAEKSAENSEKSAQQSAGYAEQAKASAETAQTAETGAKGYAESAEKSANEASESAKLAEQAMEIATHLPFAEEVEW